MDDVPLFLNSGAACRSAFVMPRRTMRSGFRTPVDDFVVVVVVVVVALCEPEVEPGVEPVLEGPDALPDIVLEAALPEASLEALLDVDWFTSDVVLGAVALVDVEGRVEVVEDVRLPPESPSVTNSNAWNGIATSFWPMPRKPPTPTTSAMTCPCWSIRMSSMSPTFSLLAP